MTFSHWSSVGVKMAALCLSFYVSTAVSAQATIVEEKREAPAVSKPGELLQKYVEKADESYAWDVRHEGKIGKTAYAELLLTSQTWRGIKWRHQMFVLMPSSATNADSALMMIAGSRWKDQFEDPDHKTKLPSEAAILAAASEQLGVPVVVLLQVPFQPMFDNLYEDALIAHTFEQFLRTDEEDWPLLLPMAKSAVRAMDATQEFLKSKGQAKPDKFIVTGASKRGWTTWLSAVVDERVKAIAPMVIDVLNMPRQMKYMEECWGDQSEMISDYTELGLHKVFETEKGKRLASVVDPYSYREQLALPKFLILGTNDPYWPVDALNVYWDDLPGEKYVLNVPNAGHGIGDISRLLGGLTAITHRISKDQPLPKLDWIYQSQEADGLALEIRSNVEPEKVVIWRALSPTRDFRQAKWKSTELTKLDGPNGKWTATSKPPETGYMAVFAEAKYDEQKSALYLSSTVRVLSAEK